VYKKNMNPNLKKLLNLTPSQYDSFISKLSSDEKLEIIVEAEEYVLTFMAVLGYVGARYGFGCGDQGHDMAVKECNKFIAKTKKILGYNVHLEIKF